MRKKIGDIYGFGSAHSFPTQSLSTVDGSVELNTCTHDFPVKPRLHRMFPCLFSVPVSDGFDLIW